MKLCRLGLALLLTVTAAAKQAENPISKVIQLISDLQGKIIKEGEDAQRVFGEFSEWCEDRARNVGFEIKTGKAQITELQAAISSATAQIGASNAKIEELANALATDGADLKAAKQIREKETADFAVSEKDLVETVDLLTRSIGVLEREMKKHGSAALTQMSRAGDVAKALASIVDAATLNSQDVSRLTALVQTAGEDDDGPSLGAPAAAVYAGHGSGIIETLEDLLDKAKEQLDQARSKEMSSKHNFEMLVQSLEDEIKFAEKEMADRKKALATSGDAKATNEGEMQVTSAGLQEDEKTKETLHRDCMEKSQDFEAETKSRAEELKALAEAKKAIQENAAGGAEANEYGLNQVSFLQVGELSAMNSATDLANFEAVQLVRDLARREKDRNLALLAKRMSAAMRSGAAAGEGDPFGKVKGLIKDMIDKLLSEGGADASHKAYCDKEMGETQQKLEDKTASIDKLTTHIDSSSAKSAQLKAEVAALQKSVADLLSSQAAADKIRSEEHAAFVQETAENEKGLEGVKLGLKILREYYAKDADHESATGAGNGIIGMLEVVESDLTKSLAEGSIAEQSAQSEYEEQTKEGRISKTMKDQSIKYKTKEAKALDVRLAEATSDRETEHAELAAVQEYDGKIQEMCVAKPMTYEERTRRRGEEIAGLKEALKVLQGESVLLQGRTSLRGIRRVRAAA